MLVAVVLLLSVICNTTYNNTGLLCEWEQFLVIIRYLKLGIYCAFRVRDTRDFLLLVKARYTLRLYVSEIRYIHGMKLNGIIWLYYPFLKIKFDITRVKINTNCDGNITSEYTTNMRMIKKKKITIQYSCA